MTIPKSIHRQARHLLRLCYANGTWDENRAQMLLLRVLAARPRGCLALLVEFQRLLKLEQDRRTAQVEAAIPVPPELAANLYARLERIYGCGLHVSFAHNPSLIGGMRITVGSDVYDSSVRGRLTALAERL